MSSLDSLLKSFFRLEKMNDPENLPYDHSLFHLFNLKNVPALRPWRRIYQNFEMPERAWCASDSPYAVYERAVCVIGYFILDSRLGKKLNPALVFLWYWLCLSEKKALSLIYMLWLYVLASAVLFCLYCFVHSLGAPWYFSREWAFHCLREERISVVSCKRQCCIWSKWIRCAKRTRLWIVLCQGVLLIFYVGLFLLYHA